MNMYEYIDGLSQDCGNSNTLANGANAILRYAIDVYI